MQSRKRRLPAPGVVLGVIALVVATAGTSIALPGKNKVDRNDIKANAVGAKQIRAGAVGGSEVNENGLGQVRSAKNAATVGGKTAAQLDTRWALINEDGEIEQQTGGFTIVNCYTANANCYIDAGDDVTNNAISAEIAINNVDGSPTFSGQVGVAPCGTAFVACAPPDTEDAEVLVVAPRDSAGAIPGGVAPPVAADASRFYVFVTGSESVPPTM